MSRIFFKSHTLYEVFLSLDVSKKFFTDGFAERVTKHDFMSHLMKNNTSGKQKQLSFQIKTEAKCFFRPIPLKLVSHYSVFVSKTWLFSKFTAFHTLLLKLFPASRNGLFKIKRPTPKK